MIEKEKEREADREIDREKGRDIKKRESEKERGMIMRD